MPPIEDERDEDREEDNSYDDGQDDENQFEAGSDEDADADDGDEVDRDADGGEVDSGEEDADGSDEEGEPEGRPAQVKRRKGVGDIRREAREARERAEKAERELADHKAQATRQQQTPQETAEQRAARLAKMSPGELTHYLVQESEARTQAALNNIAFQNFDSGDRAAFAAACAANPAVKGIAKEVEGEVERLRKTGQIVTRETAAAFLLGKKILAGAPAARAKAKAKGDASREKHTAKPGGSRSDQRGGAKKSTDERSARKNRLLNAKL